MKRILSVVSCFVCVAVANTSCEKEASAPAEQVVVIQSSGDISDDVENFRNNLGPLNTTSGTAGGRREISWDAVPDSLNNKPLPLNFFNQTSDDAQASFKKGLTYSSTGTFMVSNDGFQEINSGAAAQFAAFSGSKTFANTSAVKWEVGFQKPGATNAASVQGFGMVFSDVDKSNTTAIEFFNGEKSLGKYFALPHDATSNFSFVGVYFKNDERITKVEITHDGFLAEGINDITNGGTRDLIVLDDFIYSDPVVQ